MTQVDNESSDTENEHHYKSLRESISVGKKEFFIIFSLIGAYFYLRFFVGGSDPTIIIALGLIVGVWLAFRPSEWAVEGVESIAGHLLLTAYVAGMLTSLASNLPEAFISGFTAIEGVTTGNQDLLDIAILSVLVAAGFNMILLGITIVISTRKEGEMKVPEEVISKDTVLIRWTIVALVSIFALGLVSMVFNIWDVVTGALQPEHIVMSFPAVAAVFLFFSYIFYAVVLAKDDSPENAEMAEAHHAKRTAAILWTIGIIGIFFAGEILTTSVEMMLHHHHDAIAAVANPIPVAALILGAAGALPEHGIAVIAAIKGKIGLAIGNLVGGILQILLLVMGGIGMIAPIPLDRYVLFQIVVIAGCLWFVKRAITDDEKLDMFEGMMIILLQVFVFLLMLV